MDHDILMVLRLRKKANHIQPYSFGRTGSSETMAARDSSSSDGDIVGAPARDSGAAPVASRSSGKRARSRADIPAPTPQASPGRNVADSAPDDGFGDNDEVQCYLCSKGGILTGHYRGFKLHGACSNAVRAHNRLLDKDAKAEADRELFQTPRLWRRRVMPLVVPPGAKRSAQQRFTVKTSVQERYTRTETKKDMMQLTLQRYVKYRTWWDEMSVAEATAAFWEAVNEQSEHENSDGEVTVNLRDNVRVSRITGSTSSTRVEADEDADEGPSQFAPRAHVAAAASFMQMAQRFGDDDDEDSVRKRGRSPPKLGDETIFRTPPAKTTKKLTAANLQALPSQARSSAGPGSARGDAAAVHPRQVHLLKARAELQQQVRQALDEATNSRSDYQVLTKKMQGTTGDKLKMLDIDAQEVLKNLRDKLVDPLEALNREMAHVHIREIDTKQVAHPHTSQPI